jgi:peptide/nickel transport system ATP-binding protein
MTTTEVVLEAEGLTKHFPVRKRARDLYSRQRRAVHAVDDVDLTLRRGRVTALVGESGSGKTTVARLLAQLDRRTSGDIRLHGRSVSVRSGRRFRAYCRRVQMIFQDPFTSLNPVHTVRYHLTRALRIHGHAGTNKAELQANLRTLMGRVQLTPPERYLDKFPHELSGGQRQRVAIARALGADPEALLADEPVSMLDVSIRLDILNLLRDIKERLNLAILYITHDIATARYFADETLVMYAGRIVEGGVSETVTQRPAHPYTRLLIDSAPGPDRVHGSIHGSSAAGGDATPRDRAGPTRPAGYAAAKGAPAGYAAAKGAPAGAGAEPPSLIAPPPGCRFHPRCAYAMPRCETDLPPRFDIGHGTGTAGGGTGHWAACWLYEPAAQDTAGAGARDTHVELSR